MTIVKIFLLIIIVVIVVNYLIIEYTDVKVDNTIVRDIKNVPQENYLSIKSDKNLKGIFNPSFAQIEDNCYLFARETTGLHKFKKYFLGYFMLDSSCKVIQYDKNFRQQIKSFELNTKLEDIRTMTIKDKIYCLGHNRHTKTMEMLVLNKDFKIISEIKFKGKLQKWEKNWVFLPQEVQTEKKILIQYSAHPKWKIVSFDIPENTNSTVEIKDEFVFDNNLWNYKYHLRNTSNWISVNGCYYCMLHMKIYTNLTSVICSVLAKIDKNFKPIELSKPLNLDKANERIQFPSGLHEINGDIFVGMGINDENVVIQKYSPEYLEHIAFGS